MPASMNAGDIFVTLKAITGQFTRGMGIAHNRMFLMEKQSAVLGMAISTGLAGAFAVAGGAAIKMAGDFDESLGKIQGLVGMAQGDVRQFREEILKLGGETLKAPKELGDALYFITSAGIRESSEAMRTLKATSIAAAGGLGEVKTVAHTVVSAMNAFKKSNLSAEMATSVLVNTVREGNVEANSIAGVFGRVIPVASALGVEMHEVGAGLAALTRFGVTAEEATTGLRRLLLSLSAPGKEASEAFNSVGLSANFLRKLLDEDDGLAKVLIQLGNATDKSFEKIEAAIPNLRALTPALALLGDNSEDVMEIFRKLSATMKNDFTKPLEAQRGRINAVATELNTEFAVAITNVGDALGKALTPALESATHALNAFNEMWGELSEFQRDSFAGTLIALSAMVVTLVAVKPLVTFAVKGFVALDAIIVASSFNMLKYRAAMIAAHEAGTSFTAVNMVLNSTTGQLTAMTAQTVAFKGAMVAAAFGIGYAFGTYVVIPLQNMFLEMIGIEAKIQDIWRLWAKPAETNFIEESAKALMENREQWDLTIASAEKYARKQGEWAEVWKKVGGYTKESAIELVRYTNEMQKAASEISKTEGARRAEEKAISDANEAKKEAARIEKNRIKELKKLQAAIKSEADAEYAANEAKKAARDILYQLIEAGARLVTDGLEPLSKSQEAFNELWRENIALGNSEVEALQKVRAEDEKLADSRATLIARNQELFDRKVKLMISGFKDEMLWEDKANKNMIKAFRSRQAALNEDKKTWIGWFIHVTDIIKNLETELENIKLDGISDGLKGFIAGDENSFASAFAEAGQNSANAFIDAFVDTFMKKDTDFVDMLGNLQGSLAGMFGTTEDRIGDVIGIATGAMAAYQSRDIPMSPIERGMLAAQIGGSTGNGWGALIGGAMGFVHGLLDRLPDVNPILRSTWFPDEYDGDVSDWIDWGGILGEANSLRGGVFMPQDIEGFDLAERTLANALNTMVRDTYSSVLDLVEMFGDIDIMTGLGLDTFSLPEATGEGWEMAIEDILQNWVPGEVLRQLHTPIVKGLRGLGFNTRGDLEIREIFDQASRYTPTERLEFLSKIIAGAVAINEAIDSFGDDFNLGSVDAMRESFDDVFSHIDLLQQRMLNEMDVSEMAADAGRIADLIMSARQSEIQMLQQIDQIQQQVSDSIQQSIEDLKLGGMGAGGQLEYFAEKLSAALTLFENLVNPEDIANSASDIHELIMNAVGVLGEDLDSNLMTTFNDMGSEFFGMAGQWQAIADMLGVEIDSGMTAREFFVALLESLDSEAGGMFDTARDEVTAWADRLEAEALETADILFTLGMSAERVAKAFNDIANTTIGMADVIEAQNEIQTVSMTPSMAPSTEGQSEINVLVYPELCVNVTGDAAGLIKLIDSRNQALKNVEPAWG